MDSATFRSHGHKLVDWIADYLDHADRYPVLARVKPGEIAAGLPDRAPEEGEPFDAIMADFERVLVPGLTHWNHPGFLAYFAITASAPGVLAEFLSAALNQQAMLWRTSPAATELEAVTLGWLRTLMGLPETFEGVIYDTASIATLHALIAARHAALPDVGAKGLAGRADVPRLRVYCSEQAHSAADKAAIAIGLGLESLHKIAVDDQFRMRADALGDAIAADRAAGFRPLAVVATVGTTSTTSIDPVPAIADLCRRERLWLHVDGAYAGVAAMLPSHAQILDGVDRADSFVVNPHKWLFTPFDLSPFY
jgi:aromatic-L-amino-acid decarboxylase